jgi:hypothetical protein
MRYCVVYESHQHFDRRWCSRVLRLTLTTLYQTTRATFRKIVISKTHDLTGQTTKYNTPLFSFNVFAKRIHKSSFIVCSCHYMATKISLHKTFKGRIFQFDRKLSTLTHPLLVLPSCNSIKIFMKQVTLAWLSSPSVTQPLMAPHSLLERTLLAQTSDTERVNGTALSQHYFNTYRPTQLTFYWKRETNDNTFDASVLIN